MGETDSWEYADHHSLNHEEIRALLPEYATALVLGQPTQAQYSHIAAHIAECVGCREALEELQTLVEPSYSGELEPVANMPQFNLSFLQAKDEHDVQAVANQQPPHAWSIDPIGRLVIPLSMHIPPAMHQPTMLHSARGERLRRWEIETKLPEDVHITIEIFDTADPTVVSVQAQLDLAMLDNPLDQAGRIVRLRGDEHDWAEVTDEAGLVRFALVVRSLLPQLQLVIEL